MDGGGKFNAHAREPALICLWFFSTALVSSTVEVTIREKRKRHTSVFFAFVICFCDLSVELRIFTHLFFKMTRTSPRQAYPRGTTRVQTVESCVRKSGRVIKWFQSKALGKNLLFSFTTSRSGWVNRTIRRKRESIEIRRCCTTACAWQTAGKQRAGCATGRRTGETTNSLRVEIQLTF